MYPYLAFRNNFNIKVAFPHVKHLLVDTCGANLITQLHINYDYSFKRISMVMIAVIEGKLKKTRTLKSENFIPKLWFWVLIVQILFVKVVPIDAPHKP